MCPCVCSLYTMLHQFFTAECHFHEHNHYYHLSYHRQDSNVIKMFVAHLCFFSITFSIFPHLFPHLITLRRFLLSPSQFPFSSTPYSLLHISSSLSSSLTSSLSSTPSPPLPILFPLLFPHLLPFLHSTCFTPRLQTGCCVSCHLSGLS
jgi:hypothetical protein